MFPRSAPVVPLLIALLCLLGAVGAGALSVGMVRDTQARKNASLCAPGSGADCLLRVKGELRGPDEAEESAGDRYDFDAEGPGAPDDADQHAFFTGQRSDRMWEVRDRVVAAYFWNGDLVGIEDPDGGGLIRSERFSLRGPLAGILLEAAAVVAGCAFLLIGRERRARCRSWFTAQEADARTYPRSTVLPVLLGMAAFGLAGIGMLLWWGAAWWFIVLLYVGVGAALAYPHVVRARPARRDPRRSGNPAVRAKRARR